MTMEDRAAMKDKVAIVTGGGSGLGRATVSIMVARGASVVVFDRDRSAAERVAAEHASAVPYIGDVTDEASFDEAIALARSAFGGFDVIHNNAAIEMESHLHETSTEEWDLVLNVNLRSVFFGCRAAVRSWLDYNTGGAIVNTTSVGAHAAASITTAYAAAKSGIFGLTKAIADGYGEKGIRANCVSPGEMETPMMQKYFDAFPDPSVARAEVEKRYPIGRFADPVEVAKAVVFLASDDASFVNGQTLIVDGGMLARLY